MFPSRPTRTTLSRLAKMRRAAPVWLIVIASLAMACQRSPATTLPPPVAAPGDTLMVHIADESVVRVKVAMGDADWQEGLWLTTSSGCKGVLLTADQLFIRLAALTAVELSTSSAGGQKWEPVEVTRIGDGEGCANPAGF